MTDREVPEGAVSTERLVFFSDAVVAIAMTLLALELPVPTGATNAEFLHTLGEHRGEYLAFGISFLVIATYWRAHHRLFAHIAAVSKALMMYNLLWLFAQVVTPFATEVIAGDGAFEARFLFYVAVQLLAGVGFQLITWEARRSALLWPDTSPRAITESIHRSAAQSLGFLVSVPIAFFTHWAYACWAVFPHGYYLYTLARDRRGPRRTGTPDGVSGGTGT
ncbi:TMEM175 family protein [Actinokineospora inagensis]|uniref:TMEM175 family protein n=1 Tax=Actinokineospora inagensis TaxID=103730 RepID=UPI001FDFF53A|nr:TMEM175 family protein [Actinokineospora inagensis]